MTPIVTFALCLLAATGGAARHLLDIATTNNDVNDLINDPNVQDPVYVGDPDVQPGTTQPSNQLTSAGDSRTESLQLQALPDGSTLPICNGDVTGTAQGCTLATSENDNVQPLDGSQPSAGATITATSDVGGASGDVGRKLQQVSTVEGDGLGSGTIQLTGNSDTNTGTGTNLQDQEGGSAASDSAGTAHITDHYVTEGTSGLVASANGAGVNPDGSVTNHGSAVVVNPESYQNAEG